MTAKASRYDPVDMVLALQQAGTPTAGEQVEAPAGGEQLGTPAPSPPSGPRTTAVRPAASTGVDDSLTTDAPDIKHVRKVQMNLNVDPATKQRLRELWKPIAADHHQGEII